MKPALLYFFLFVTSFCFSQRTITGTISDAYGALIGTVVSLKGSKVYTETDFDGKYSIKANPEDVLVFSYSGFKTREIVADKKNEIDLKLEIAWDCLLPIIPSINLLAIHGINYETYGLNLKEIKRNCFFK